MTVEGKNILIFGGTGELFGCIAKHLADNGAKVIVVGRSIKDNITEYVENGSIHFTQFDITTDNVKDLFDRIYAEHNQIDVLINGAGVNSATPFLEITEEEMDHILNVNYKFVVKCCQEFIRRNLDAGAKGKIINAGSVSGVNPLSRVFTYSASKSALHNLSKNIAREFGSRGITTNILVPGFFPAEQNKKILTPERTGQILGMTPMDRFGEPQELCGMVKLLCSDDSNFINGAELVVDGGYCATKI